MILHPSDVTQMIARRRNMLLCPFEPIEASPNYRLPSFEKKIDSILKRGYPMRPSHLFLLDAPLPWHHTDRTIAYNLQAFEPLSPLLMAHSLMKRQDCFDLALAFLEDWLQQVRPPTETELEGQWKEAHKKDFLWYDMAVGLRSYRLAYMIDHLMRLNAPDEGKLCRLMEVLDWHRQIMVGDKAFSKHNNHGLYQALGQVAMTRRFQDLQVMQEAFVQGEERLKTMLEQQFFESGVHREHSPGYHWMILGTLQEAVRVGLIHTDEHKAFISRIEEAMSWFIGPNLMLPAFGDTDAGGVLGGYYEAKDFTHPHLRFALSGGTLGKPPDECFKVYQEAGYAILKNCVEDSACKGAYFVQHGGFHSTTHKHADHLSFVWHDKDEDILVDAGRYGYKGKTERGSPLWHQGFWYSDPKRIYVEKTRAHNTVEIDGLDFPRRKAKLFGSALKRTATTDNGVYGIESECRHFQTIRHARVLFVSPGGFLLVFDWLKENTPLLHDFRQWFHLGQHLDLMVSGDILTLTNKGVPFASVVSLVPDSTLDFLTRGQPEPDLNGWVSHEKGGILCPNWAFAYGASRRTEGIFATLFTLHPDVQDWQESHIAPSGQSGKFTWRDRAGQHKLSFKRRPQEDFTLQYTLRKQPDGVAVQRSKRKV